MREIIDGYVHCVGWRGKFWWFHDPQCIGRSLACNDLVIEVENAFGGRTKLPVDWSRLQEFQPELYDAIRLKIESRNKTVTG